MTAAEFTFSFNCLGEVSMQERLDAAQAAGFTDIGISIRWMGIWLESHDLAELDAMLAARGQRITELEAVRVMGLEPDPRGDLAAMLAEHYRPMRLQSVGPYVGTLDEAAARVARVADRFAQWGVEVVLEPLPFTNMSTPAIAADIIRRSGCANVSMCLDIWHLYRADLPMAHLDDLWPVISTVQFNDGTIVAQHPDLLTDCLENRMSPGAGEFDLIGLVRQRDLKRPDATFSIEVISKSLRTQDSTAAAQAIADGINLVLTASRS